MKKRNGIKKRIFAAFATAFLTAALSACGAEETGSGEGSGSAEEWAFGVDYSEELAVSLVEQIICGQDSAWAITTVKNDFIYRFYDGDQGIETEELEWQPGEGDYSLINIAERNGVLYAELSDKEEAVIQVCKYREYVGWSDVMTVKPEDGDWGIVGSGFFVDGSENVYLVNGTDVARFEGEGKQACEYELEGNVCAFQESGEGSVLCVTAGANVIRLYELGENKALEKWTWKEEEALGQVYVVSGSEEGMLCLATNDALLFFDMESGSLRARSDLVKIGVSSVLAGYYDGEEGTLRLYGAVGSGSEGLYSSRLSVRDAEEQRTELVYGMIGGANAYTDSSIWTAITAFNQTNEEYYITIKNYGDWAGLERYNADLAAGNGPDIIDMTWFVYNYDSLARNGYLENLSPYLEQSEYKDDILWNVLDVYKVDGGLYMFVPQFQLRGILIHPDYADRVEEWNLETFLELIEEDKWDKIIYMKGLEPEYELLYYLLFGMQEELIDREQKTANFEAEEFLDMLALCREYGEICPDTSGWVTDDWAGKKLFIPWMASSLHDYVFETGIHGREYPVYGFPTLSGQTYGISASYDACAIYAGSKNKEGAWEFIESLLWDSNQTYRGLVQPGIPIRISLMEEMAEESKEIECIVNGEKVYITDSEIEIQKDIIYNGELVNYSVMIDSDIWAVVEEETAAYFAGDKTAGEVAHIIQSRVGIILAE